MPSVDTTTKLPRRFGATTALLRRAGPAAPPSDVWDDRLRAARRVEYDHTQALVRRWAHWLLPMLVTGLVGAVGLSGPGLWTDELATWGMSGTPWPQFWPVLGYVDAVLAPYYVLMHGWVQVFGDSDVALRLPSLWAMAASAGLIAALGTRLAGRRAGLLAGLVFALLPSTSRFAAEARPYALTVLAAVAATYLLVRAWQSPAAWRWWMAYGCAIAALGLLHIVGALLVAAHASVVLAWHRRAWWRFGIAAAAGVAVSLPLLVSGMRQRHQVAYIPSFSLYSIEMFTAVIFGGIALTVLLVGLASFSLPLRYPSAIWAAWAVVPVATLVLVSQVMPMFLPRYLLYTTPGWALLAGAALARLRTAWGVSALVIVAILALPAQVAMRRPDGHDQATSQLAAIVAAQSQPGDGIVYADDEPIGAWTARDTIAHYVPTANRPADVLATNPPRTDGLLLATECADVAQCLLAAPRLWIVRAGQQADPLAGLGAAKTKVLREQYQVVSVWYPAGLTLALLQRRSGHG